MSNLKEAAEALSKATELVLKAGYDKAMAEVCAWLEACAVEDDANGHGCTSVFMRDIAAAIKNREQTVPPPPPDVTLP